jgi:hypothetical protein
MADDSGTCMMSWLVSTLVLVLSGGGATPFDATIPSSRFRYLYPACARPLLTRVVATPIRYVSLRLPPTSYHVLYPIAAGVAYVCERVSEPIETTVCVRWVCICVHVGRCVGGGGSQLIKQVEKDGCSVAKQPN